MKDWQHAVPDIEAWDSWDGNVGLRAARYPAIDIDILEPAVAAQVAQFVADRFGVSPCRIGQAPKMLFPYKLAAGSRSVHKRRLVVGRGAVEVLGSGQQYVVAGIHPKTLQPYSWNCQPEEIHSRLIEVTADQLEAFLDDLAALFDLVGIATKLPSKSAGGESQAVGARAPSLSILADAVSSIPNDLDYDGWIRLGRAIKGAAEEYASIGLDDGLELWAQWSATRIDGPPADYERCKYHWDSLHPPHGLGWDHILKVASEKGGWNRATGVFDQVEITPPASRSDTGPPASISDLVDRWAWVKDIECAVELATGERLNRNQFNIMWARFGDPTSTRNCAWGQFVRSPGLKKFDGLTYRPGLGRELREQGRACVNTWRPSDLIPAASDEWDVLPWLSHLEYLVPDAVERNTVLQFLAFLVQRPDLKPNWALVMKSRVHGVGKDLLISPIRAALGARNCSYVTSKMLTDGNAWAFSCKLAIVEEVHTFERRSTMQILKAYVTAPPDEIVVNIKYIPQFSIPNILAFIMFTNQPDALAIEATDRRFFVVDCDVSKRDPGYYRTLVDWYAHGGLEAVAGYLGGLDIAGFNWGGSAPDSAAKTEMEHLSRSGIEAWVHDGIADCTPPFNFDVVTLAEIIEKAPPNIRINAHKLNRLLIEQGGRCLGRGRLNGNLVGNFTVVSLRNHFENATPTWEAVRERYWQVRKEGETVIYGRF